MDLLNKIEKFIGEAGGGGAMGGSAGATTSSSSGATTTTDVAKNLARGHVDVVGGKCPEGYRYDKNKKVCVPIKNESVLVGGSYVAGNTNIAGSGQTRAWGGRWNLIDALETKNPVELEMDDKAKENIEGRRPMKFDKYLGGYVPTHPDIDVNQMENDDEED